ncbi:MAG: substrate-binding domain-containing protein [Paludibacter sp.]
MSSLKILSFSFLVLLFSCQNKVKDKFTDTYTTGVIPIAVDENFKPIIQEEIDVFEALTPKANIIPNYTTEVEVLNLLLKDSVRLAIATRPLSSKEEKYLNSKSFYPHSYKFAHDGLALIVNKLNQDTMITVNDIRRILMGQVTNWNEIFPKSRLGKFQIVFDNQNSSTIRYAIDSICDGKSLSKKLYAQNNNLEVIDFVSRTPNAIGIIGVNWLGNKKDTTNLSFRNEVNVMAVSSESEATSENSYKPFQAYLFYGYYPLTRYVYVIMNDPRGSLPSGFTNFLTSDRGQRIVLKSGLVPATQPVRVVQIKDEK